MASTPQEEVLAHVPYHATRSCTRRPPAEGSAYWCTDRPEDKVAFGVELEGRAWVKEVALTVVGASHVEIRGAEGVGTQYRDARRIMKKREVRDMFAFKANTSPENRVVLTPTEALDAQLTYGCLFIALFNHWDPLVPLGVKDLRIVGACDTQNCASQPHPPSLAPTLSVYNPHKPVAAWKAATAAAAVPDAAVPKATVAVPEPKTQPPAAVASQQPSVQRPPAAAPRPKPVPAVPAAAPAAPARATVAPVAAAAAVAASAAPPRAPAAFRSSSFKTPEAQSAKAAYLTAAAAFETAVAEKAPPAPLQATLPQLPQTLQQPPAPAPPVSKPVPPQAGFTPAPFVPLGAAPAPPCVAPPQPQPPPPQQPAAAAWHNTPAQPPPPAPPQAAVHTFESAPVPYAPPRTQKPLDGVTICLSGFVNPERSQLRQAALSLGASFVDDFRQGGTHLIAAFPDTPKARDVAASGSGFIVSADWLREAVQNRKRPAEAPHALAPPMKKKKMYAVP
eukprot:Rhum_TRINITY_DN14788_c39_g1::Rhum_TRINITY_DN14788_c39_g1_i1::g.119283::m.119283